MDAIFNSSLLYQSSNYFTKYYMMCIDTMELSTKGGVKCITRVRDGEEELSSVMMCAQYSSPVCIVVVFPPSPVDCSCSVSSDKCILES